MVLSPRHKLSPLQVDLLGSFFRLERRFYLTGGAALAGYYLGHRETTDLDLFTTQDDAFEQGPRSLAAAAAAIGAVAEVKRHEPGFMRYFVRRDSESVVVDLVRDYAPQVHGEKLDHGGVLVDSPQEILTNKLTTLLSRGESRDLVDVMFLERQGFKVEDHIPFSQEKDGGCTPATLAWVLSQIRIRPESRLPADVVGAEMTAYLSDLVVRLRRMAFPG